MSKMLSFDCVVIGSGAAGMTAAVYLKRANLSVALIEKSAPGGQMNNSYNIENYPGFKKIDGVSLSLNMHSQVINTGVDYKYGNVLDIENFGNYKVIKTDLEEIKCKVVIIASGRVPRKLGLENEDMLIGRGIAFCALCDGSFYKDKVVAIVGGGNSAIEDAIYLAGICKEVIIIHRRDYFTADVTTQDKLKNFENIKIKYNSVVNTLYSNNNSLSSINIKTNDQEQQIAIDGLFLNVGYVPDTKYLINLGIKLDNNYVIVDEHMRTNVKNVYACGDVIKKEIYQITTAVGDGTIAATSAKKDIN
ncbi:MAG: FAD-dependent oxidoreductase [Bacilli bacterium]|nr:FAD-dependent oxidoreductase [Bacilli bacterium]MDD4282368.1 FAD-dependent oxidoreductase [Bacilli bacterium]MDD4718257.1 FAD-dependent oxidoreductase [Bacilli bacterium]